MWRCWAVEWQGEGGVGWEVSYFIYFCGKWHCLCIKAGFKKASLINVHSFIAEVKLKRSWRPRRRDWCLTPPLSRKPPHGKNISKHRSIKDGPLRSSDCIAFVTYKKDGPLRSSECITFVTFCQKDSPLGSSEYFILKCLLYIL